MNTSKDTPTTTKASEADVSGRELLELAAKAAGADWAVEEDGRFEILSEIGGFSGYWNPLTDDGDALRLAVKLGMQIDMRDPETRIYALGAGDVITEYHTNRDALAATRLCVVRAAAAIAKGEK